ncbi:protein sprint-like [Paramacrobiotus metropolitanus]|uniref:protein sprint-like n=1 Tax=Paramacrobiotus metropolitanus TaxID=2943436 RepID=UPI0024465561|nr:protein sprint-like [Paramacrobiotus metropolitanus]
MPAVGSQMLSHVNSELMRYSDSESGVYGDPQNLRMSLMSTSSLSKSSAQAMKFDTNAKENLRHSEDGGSEPGGLLAAQPDTTSDDKMSLLEKMDKSVSIWFRPETDRLTAETLLRNAELGSFIVRYSSLPQTLALSVTIPISNSKTTTVLNSSGNLDLTTTQQPNEGSTTNQLAAKVRQRVEHYLIETSGSQLALEGSDLVFPSLALLVHHYAQSRSELPVNLRLPKAVEDADSHHQLTRIIQSMPFTDFWKSASTSRAAVNIDIASTAVGSPSMLLDSSSSPAVSHAAAAAPPITVHFSNRRLTKSRLSPESSSGNLPATASPRTTLTVPADACNSRLSSKISDYEDIWSLAGTKSPDYAMSDPDGGSHDHSSVETSSNSAKAVGMALRDLDALGDWIESELHDQRLLGVDSSHSHSPAVSLHDYHNGEPLPPVKEEFRVIRRGKRRFPATTNVSPRNRFSAPNLPVNVEDMVPENNTDTGEEVISESVSYSSVHDLSEAHEPVDAVLPTAIEYPDQRTDSDDFVTYTPPRKCMPSRDQNIIESFQSKVTALKRIGSKLLSKKISLNGMTNNTLPKSYPSKESPQLQEKVLVFRSKKASYDQCWPVDNGNWSVNRVTPTTTSDGSSASSTHADYAAARHLTIRSSKSPSGTSPKRSRTFSEFSDLSRDIQHDISLERIVNYITKTCRADFTLSLLIGQFVQKLAPAPVDNVVMVFNDVKVFCASVEKYILTQHRHDLEDFSLRDVMGEVDVKRLSLDLYVNAAVQRLVVEPLSAQLVWNIQAQLGASGELARLEKGCQVLDSRDLAADDIEPEILYSVIDKLSAIAAHFRNFAEAQSLLTKGKQLFTVFSDVFGIEANPLDCSFTDVITAFAVAITKSKAYNIEIHLEFMWHLQPVEFKSASYFPVLLAASCATTVLKYLATDSKLRIADAVAKCLVPAQITVIVAHDEECPVISQTLQIPLDKRLLANHVVQLLTATSDLSSNATSSTLQINAGPLAIIQSKETILLPAFDRWRALFPDCILTLLVQTKATGDE